MSNYVSIANKKNLMKYKNEKSYFFIGCQNVQSIVRCSFDSFSRKKKLFLTYFHHRSSFANTFTSTKLKLFSNSSSCENEIVMNGESSAKSEFKKNPWNFFTEKILHNGPENLKKSRPKKTREIKQINFRENIFLKKGHFHHIWPENLKKSRPKTCEIKY